MDRNTVIGFILIAVLFIGYSIFNMPSKEEIERTKKAHDSIALVKKNKEIEETKLAAQNHKDTVQLKPEDSSPADTTIQLAKDTAVAEQFVTLENDVMKITLTSRGGRVYSVVLKKFKTWNGKPLILFNGDKSSFGYSFFTGKDELFNTGNIPFTADRQSVTVSGKDSSTLVFRAELSEGKYLEQIYTITGNSYLMNYNFRMVGLNEVIKNNVQNLRLEWDATINNSEKNITDNRGYSTVYYKFQTDDALSLSTSSDEEKKLTGNIEWVCYKEHFFNSTLISKQGFEHGTVSVKVETDSSYTKSMKAELILPYKHEPETEYAMQMYFGPNNYLNLKKLHNGMEEIVPMGWGIFAWFAAPVNKYFIIPLFHFFSSFLSNWGLIIFIMTILIKIILTPLTYRSLLSAAKMKVIKPEIDELREKYKDDQAKFGQEQLKLFQKAGVNPLGGCLPILLQLPILVAMYSFFPSSIELRQQSLWWANDLSTFDSIWTFPNHINIPFYGDHVSLFTILMTVSQIIYAVYNNQLTGATGQMKWMQYLFPVMLLGIFNNLSAALTYYYFLSNIVTFGQQWIVQTYFLDTDKIHRQIQERKKNPSKKKPGFLSRLEEAQRKQQQQLKNKGKK